MKFINALSISLSAISGDNSQEVGYCGVPAVLPNENLFENLPVRSYHTQKQEEMMERAHLEQQKKNAAENESNAPSGPQNHMINHPGASRIQSHESSSFAAMRGRSGRSSDEELFINADYQNSDSTNENSQSSNNSEFKYGHLLEASPTSKPDQQKVWALRNKNVDSGFYENVITTRIIGGEAAVRGSWPWQVHLSICGEWTEGRVDCNICGGSLIGKRWVVTAAHCIPEFNKERTHGTVSLGMHDVHEWGQQRIEVEEFISHPQWNTPFKYNNDIGLLRLKEDAKYSDVVSPICLPEKSVCFTEGTACVASGWGLLNERGGFPETLQEVAVKVIDRERCRKYSGYEHITSSMICAGYEAGRKDACAGDSGGPLVCRDGPRDKAPWVLYGIVSWGYGCARPGSPGVYTNVPNHVDWIKEVTSLAGQVGMEKCYDGTKDLPKSSKKSTNSRKDDSRPSSLLTGRPDNTSGNSGPVATQVAAPVASAMGVSVTTESFNCVDSNGEGKFHTDSGVWKSNRYPQPYANNQNCYYCVSPATPGGYVEVVIQELQLDRKKNCHKNGDYMMIEQENKPAKYLCHVKKRDKYHISNRGNICLKFVTNGAKAKRGFIAKYSQIKSPPSGCGGDQILTMDSNYKNATHNIKSKSWPQKYNDKQPSQCLWSISMDPAMRQQGIKMVFEFTQFQLEKNRDLVCNADDTDKLIIYGATSCEPSVLQSAPIIVNLCSFYKHSDRLSFSLNQHSVCMVFDVNGDNSKNGNGFYMSINLSPSRGGGDGRSISDDQLIGGV